VGRALFGFAPAERLSFERFLQVVHPEDREAVRQAGAAAVNGQGDYESEYRVVSPDGQVHWMAGRGRVEFEGGQPRRLRGVSLDVTRRKQVEGRFRAMVEAAPNAMIMVDAAGTIVLANAQAGAVFGYGPQELVRRPVEALEFGLMPLLLGALAFGVVDARANVAGELALGRVPRDAMVKQPAVFPIGPPEAVLHSEGPVRLETGGVGLEANGKVVRVHAFGPTVS
jgi:PAS domain S-box-containing protein